MELDSVKKGMKESVEIYITHGGLLLFSMTSDPKEDKVNMMASFLHAIDIFASEFRKTIGGSTEFHGFAFSDAIEVSVMEVGSENGTRDVSGGSRIFIKNPYGKIPRNNRPVIALLGATRDTVSRIKAKELSVSVNPKKTVEYFKEKLKDRGYTLDNLMKELSIHVPSRSRFKGFMPIALFSIEQKNEKEDHTLEMKEKGAYHRSIKKNPLKNEDGTFTLDPSLLAGLAEALQTYQKSNTAGKGSILLRFTDHLLEVSYKKDGSPIVGVLVKGRGIAEEVRRYRGDIRSLVGKK